VGQTDDILSAITRIHAAGLDPTLWADALSSVTELIGGLGASLEFLQRPSMQHSAMYMYGLDDGLSPYLEHYAPLSPRLSHAAKLPIGSVLYDGQWIDEAGMNAHPFHMEFLEPMDMRYMLGGVVAVTPEEAIYTSVQITPAQGHPTKTKIALMAALLPHMRQATDVMRWLGKSAQARATFEHTLEWLVDGVVLLANDGSVIYANAAAQKVFRSNDGITVARGALRFGSGDGRRKFGAAMQAVGRLRDREPIADMQSDFLIERRSGAADYLVSVRPLLANEPAAAFALVFLRDPVQREASNTQLLIKMFQLTAAEADVANALCLGFSPGEYARQSNVSSNTVYTHIRRLKDKTGSRRMAELIHKLNGASSGVVAERPR
jgi:DNA-binding CsgD family transcriptional regulator